MGLALSGGSEGNENQTEVLKKKESRRERLVGDEIEILNYVTLHPTNFWACYKFPDNMHTLHETVSATSRNISQRGWQMVLTVLEGRKSGSLGGTLPPSSH